MAILKPYGGLSSVRLADQINKENVAIGAPPRRLGIDYTFGSPEAFSEEGEDDNTKVVCTPLPGTKFKGPQDIQYVRLTLSLLRHLPYGYIQAAIIPPGSFYIHDILPQINVALGLDLVPEEVVNEFHDENEESYPLHIVESASLAWLDSEFEFAVQRQEPPVDISLFDAIPNNTLSGLAYALP